jgi:hypothetical protein
VRTPTPLPWSTWEPWVNTESGFWAAGFRPWQPWRGATRDKVTTWAMAGRSDPERTRHRAHHSNDPIQTYMQRQHHPFKRFPEVPDDLHFYRACPIHLDEVQEVGPQGPGAEILMCPHGHRVTSFVTMGSDGTIVGHAYKHRVPMIVGERERNKGPKRPLPPDRPCEHGHMDWTYSAPRRAYHCATCKEKKSD